MKKRTRFRGHLDRVVDGYLFGWLFDSNNPQRSVVFDLFVNGGYRGQWCCAHFRADLLGAGLGNGVHGFKVPVYDNIGAAIDADSVEIFVPSANAIWLVTKEGHFRENSAMGATRRVRLRRFRARLIESATGKSTHNANLSDASKIAAVLSTSEVYGKNRLGKLNTSDFTEFLRRLRMPKSDDIEFYNFYANEYIHDLDPRFVPLSYEEKNFVRNLVEDKRPEISSPLIPKYIKLINHKLFLSLLDAYKVYWWAAEGGRQLKLNHSCVLPDEAKRLSEIVAFGFGNSSSLTYFMMIFALQNKLVSAFSMLLPSGRRRVHEWCFDYAQKNSHIMELFGSGIPSTQEGNSCRGKIHVSGSRASSEIHLECSDEIINQNPCGEYTTSEINSDEDFAQPSKTDRIQFIGPLDKILGLGESSRRLMKAIHMVEPECNFVCYNDGIQSESTGEDYERTITHASINIIHLNAEQIPEFFLRQGDILSKSYNIIYPYWELNRVSSLHLLGLSLIDEVWTASTFISEAFRGHGLPVITVGLPADKLVEVENASLGIVRKFTFLTTFDAFSWPQRKNALASVEAFLDAFDGIDGVRLIVKTQNADKVHSIHQRQAWIALRERFYNDSRIEIINETYSSLRQKELLRSCDCLVSFHRSEGLGIDILDAIASGIPVVATAYSGNMDICTSKNCWLVDYDLVTVSPDEYVFVEEGHRWANIRHSSAVEALKNVFYNHLDRAKKSIVGIADSDRLSSSMVVGARISERLKLLRRTVLT